MLANWDPFSEISRLQNELFKRRDGNELPFRPSVDIYEDEQGIHLKADLAGVKKEDVKVTLENGIITISGERKQEKESKDENEIRVESFHGTFTRSFALPDDIDPQAIHAEAKNGVLKVHIPRTQTPKAKTVAIEVK